MLDKLKGKTYSVLRWSEKYTKTDMVYLAKGGSWMILDRAVSMLASLLLSIAFANLLPKEVFGTYKYVLSVIAILSLSTLNGMGTAQARASARGNDGDLRQAVRTEIKWGTLGALVSLGLCAAYFSQDNFALASAFGVAALCLPFFNVYSIYTNVLQGKRLFGLLARYDIWVQVANFCLILPLLFLTRQVWLLIIPFLFVNTAFQLALYRRTKKVVAFSESKDPGMIRYGKILSLTAVISVVADSADQIITYIFLGPVQLAVYNMALAPTEQMKSVFKMVVPLAFPKFAVQDKDTLRKNIWLKTLKFASLIGFFIAVYYFLAPWFYGLLFPQYLDSVLYSRLLAFSLLGLSSYLPNTALQAQKADSFYLSISVIASVFQIASVFIGLYWLGLLGLVLARILARFFNLILTLYYFRTKRAGPFPVA